MLISFKLNGLILACLGVLFFSSCGQINWVQSSNLRTYSKNGDVYSELATQMNTGRLGLPAVSLPIINPKMGLVPLGEFSIRPSLVSGSTSEIAIAINMTKVANSPATGQARLPNGTPLPIIGYDPNSVLQFGVGGNRTQVYLAIDSVAGNAMMGVAVPIRQFDQIGRYGMGLNIFPPFVLNNGLQGSFGLFTGLGSGQNGFALFMDVSSLLNNPQVTSLVAPNSQAFGIQNAKVSEDVEVQFTSDSIDEDAEDSIQWEIYKMNARGETLELY